MKIDLAFIKIPFEGTFNMIWAFSGVGFGCLCNLLVFCLADVKGPAVYLTGPALISAIGKTMGVSALWAFMYYNYVAIQVQTIFGSSVFEMFTKDDVTDKYTSNSARFAGNMFEQAPVFLSLLWAYTLLVDYETGGYLGILYMIARALYPFCYIIFRQFIHWFEFITQIGYGVNGIFMLGLFVNSFGDFSTWDATTLAYGNQGTSDKIQIDGA